MYLELGDKGKLVGCPLICEIARINDNVRDELRFQALYKNLCGEMQ